MELVSTQRINTDSDGHQAIGHAMPTLHSSISADGQWVVFETDASNLIEKDNNNSSDVFLKNIETGDLVTLSINSSGQIGNNDSMQPSISADGNIVVFFSSSSNLVDGDTSNNADVFMADLQTGTLSRLSLSYDDGNSNGTSVSIYDRVISDDNRYVVFESSASNLVPNDTNSDTDIFIRDLLTAETTRVSLSTSGGQANGDSSHGSISGDGRLVAFQSLASNLMPGDSNNERDVFVKKLTTGELICASTSSSGVIGNAESKYPTLSDNGRFVAFQSKASNLDAGDRNGVEDVFIKDLLTGETTLVSVGLNGEAGAGGSSLKPRLSGDGRFVFFHSSATNLVEGDTNRRTDVFVRDMASGETFRVSLGEHGEQGNGSSVRANCSEDGSVVIFESLASNLVAGDTNGVADLFSVNLRFDESRVTGTAGDNTLNGTPYADIIDGLGGNDRLNGDWGNDAINGGAGADVLIDGHGLDTLTGGDGADMFQLTPDDLRLDVIADFSGAAGDRVDLTAYGSGVTYGYDAATGILTVNGAAAAKVGGDFNTGYIIAAGGGGTGVTLPGTAGADSYTGTAYNDSLSGLGGNDTLTGLAGKDTLKGGGGNDNLYGGEGDDFLSGNGGYDRIADGAGLDFLYGGSEGDTFVMTRGDAALDVIWDFAGGTGALADRVDLTDFGSGATVAFNDATDVLTVNGEAVVRIVGAFSLATDVILA